MSAGEGLVTFPTGVAARSVNIGTAASELEIYFRSSAILPSDGYTLGGSQHACADQNNGWTSGKSIRVKDTSGTVILEGTTVSFASPYINFDITTQTGTVPQALLRWR